MYDENLFNLCEEHIQRECGSDKIAYHIGDNGTRTPIQLGHHELISDPESELVKLIYHQDNNRIVTEISTFDNFNIDYMLVKTTPREPNSPVSHMLRIPVLKHQINLREESINTLL